MEDKRLRELAIRAARTGRVQYTRFLDPAELKQARAAANAEDVFVRFFGGHSEAERVIAAFWADEEPQQAPLVCLELRWNAKYASAGHRDLLGAVMGLGIDRSATGDICMGREPGTACLFCTEDMADHLCAELTEAGRAKLRVRRVEHFEPAEPEGVRLHVTVQTLRLDAVAAAGYKLSRSQAQTLIAQGLVKLNHVPELRSDASVTEGALLSIRGYGRLKVERVSGETKKGRIGLEVFRIGK